MEYPFILGTAGHIDHGKTSLVKALTGVDCDRLEEEKRRGITIELGFAPLTLESKTGSTSANSPVTVSIIDVPGHERFVRQMAAGASGMDAAMLVIAASEGVMPQTREHLDILNLLGIRCGLIALTKKDIVDAETLEIAAAEVKDLTAGSCLDGAAIIPVSSTTGDGIPLILAEIARLIEKTPPRKGFGAFFLPIDRVFSKKGFGSVVTGTVAQGAIAEGDEVELMPGNIAARVRSLQTHGEKADAVQAGQRAAINLSGVSHEEIERGNAVCAKGAFTPSSCISAWLDVLPSSLEGVAHWQRVRLHAGTVDVVARIALLQLHADDVPANDQSNDPLSAPLSTNPSTAIDSEKASTKKRLYPAGSGGPIQILSESAITVAAGQRFVIRLYSPLVTIGGGRILLPNDTPVRSKSERSRKARIAAKLNGDFTPLTFLAALIHDRNILTSAHLFQLSQMEKTFFAQCIKDLVADSAKYDLIEFGKNQTFIAVQAFTALAGIVQGMLQAFHAEHPELSGLDAEKLHGAQEALHTEETLSVSDFKELVGIMAEKGIVAKVSAQGKTTYRSADFKHTPDDKFTSLVGRVKAAIEAAGFTLVTQSELEAKLAVTGADVKRAAAYLREQEDLRMTDGGFYFSRSMREKLLAVLRGMKEDITVASLRDSIGVSRKYALPMLDFFDSQGLTKRVGDKRLVLQAEQSADSKGQ